MGVGHDQGDRVVGAVADDVGGDRVGHRPSGVLRGVRCVPSRVPGASVARRARPRSARSSAWRSSGSTWRRLTVNRAAGMLAASARCFDLRGDPAGFDRRCLAGVAEDPQLTAGAGVDRGEDGVGVAGGGLGDLVEDDHRPGGERTVGEVERNGRSCAPEVRRHRARRLLSRWWPPPSPAGRQRRRSRRRRGPSRSCRTRRGRAPLAPTRPARTASTPLALVVTQEPGRAEPPGDRRRGDRSPARAARRSRMTSVSSSRLRWATVDHRAGSHPDTAALGVRRTTSSDPKNRSAMSVISRGEPPGGETGDVLDHVVFGETGVMGAQPVSSSTSHRAISSNPTDRSSGSRQHTDAQVPVPTARPTSAASACHRPDSNSGVALWSLAGRVASDASSSARIRNTGDS